MKNQIIKINENIFQGKETFLDYLDISDLTYKSYKNGIESFFKYLNVHNIAHPTRHDFKAYREEMRLNSTINTVNSYITANRAFFRFLEANSLYENITKDVKLLKTSSFPKTQTLTKEQCSNIYRNLTDKKEKCLFGLAISTGLRAKELANTKIENIKIHNGEYVLFVKRKKRDDESEYVKLSNHVMSDIYNYIEQRTTGNIFVSTSNNSKGKGLSDTSIRNIIKDIFKRFGIEQDWFSCHTLRRSMATICYQNGMDIVAIQQTLAHNSIATTKRYISQSTRDINKCEYVVSDLVLGS